MANLADFLYDLKIVSHHPTNPGPVSYAMSRATGTPTAECRQFINGERRDDFFVRGVTFTYALSIKTLISEAGGEAEMSPCPWSRGYPWSKAFG